MIDYAILECTQTLRLFQWGKAHKLPIWIPLRREGDRTVAAMPGYAFVPDANYRATLAAIPPGFRTRIFRYDEQGFPRTCQLSELSAMQKALNSEYSMGQQKPPPIKYCVGQAVIIAIGPFKGVEAVVEKVRGNTVRLVTRNGYLSIPPEYLAPH